jgi:[acyl-carrier-protein] S-malonyltransferase
MQSAAQGLASTLRAAPFADPQVQFWSPVDANRHATAGDVRDLMISQLASPVRWSALVRQLIAAGFEAFFECGPGEVLTGLNRRVGRRLESLQHIALQDPASIDAALALAI